MRVKKAMIGMLLGLGFSALSLAANALVVLQYHHISTETPKSTSTPPDLFEAHLDYLADNKFRVMGLDELAGLIRAGKPLPDKAAVITFDDGYLSVYQQAFPLLKKRGYPFAVFINTQPHDAGNPNFMSWQQMREMADAGVVFANHTVSHPHLIRRAQDESPEAWRERAWREIKTAETVIDRKLGQSHRLLAYPYGEYNAELQQMLADNGYLAFGQQSGPISEDSSRQALPRFPFGGIYGGMKSFAIKVNTLPLPVADIRVTSETGQLLEDPELPQGVERPLLVLTLKQEEGTQKINCFASGQGAIPMDVNGATVTARAPEPIPVGRSRYNCTAPSNQAGRFYWYSQMFIKRKANGSWYEG